MVDNLSIFNSNQLAVVEMNKKYTCFFKNIIFLLILLVVIDITLGKVLEDFYFKMKTGQSARITYAITKADEQIIIFGSSRANHNYVPSILEDSLHLTAYNAGIDGQSILYHYCILKNIKLRTTPKIIILDLNINEFEKGELAYNRLYALLPYYNKYKTIQPIINIRNTFESIKAISNLYRYNSFILPIILNNTMNRIEDAQKGFLPLYKIMKPTIETTYSTKLGEGLDTVKLNIFKDFIREAKEGGCKVFVFLSPIYKIQSSKSLTMISAEQICKDEQVSFINYINSSAFNLHPQYFQDELHLNYDGAGFYTRMIFKEIANTSKFTD